MDFFDSLVVVMLLISLTSTTIAQQSSSVELISEPWTPWITKTEDGQPTGVYIEMTKELFRRAGVPHHFEYYPWNRCITRIKDGDSDGLMMVGYKPEREEFLEYTDVALKDSILVYSHVDNFIEWETWEDLLPYTIGLTDGYFYGDKFEEAKKRYNFKFDFSMRDELNIKKLHGKRFDVAFLNKSVTEAYLRKHPELDTIKAAKKPLQEGVYYIAFSKKSKWKSLIPQLNRIFQEMEADGTIQELLMQLAQ